jgi:hypothetical protein
MLDEEPKSDKPTKHEINLGFVGSSSFGPMFPVPGLPDTYANAEGQRVVAPTEGVLTPQMIQEGIQMMRRDRRFPDTHTFNPGLSVEPISDLARDTSIDRLLEQIRHAREENDYYSLVQLYEQLRTLEINPDDIENVRSRYISRPVENQAIAQSQGHTFRISIQSLTIQNNSNFLEVSLEGSII